MGKKAKGKGKQPAGGRAKQRSKAQKHSPGNNAFGSPRHFFDGDDDNSPKTFRGFTQMGPQSDLSPRNVNVKLRHQAITFVSAGSNTPVEPESTTQSKLAHEITVLMKEEESSQEEVDLEDSLAEEEEPYGSTLQMDVVEAEMEISGDAMGRMHIEGSPSPSALEFVIDTTGDPSLTVANSARSNGKVPVVRTPSPARSDSSDEVVVFNGRFGRPTKTVTDDIMSAARPPSSARPSYNPPLPRPRTPHVTDDLLAALGASPGPSVSSALLPKPAEPSATGRKAVPSEQERYETASSNTQLQPASSYPYWKEKKPAPQPASSRDRTRLSEDAPAATSNIASEDKCAEATIAELQADWKAALREKKKGGSSLPKTLDGVDELDLDLGRKSNRRGKRGRKKNNRQMRNDVVSEEDSEAAYDDYMQNLAAQLDAEDDDVKTTQFTSAAIFGPDMVVDGKAVAEDEVLKHTAQSSSWEDTSSPSSDQDDDEKPVGDDLSELSDYNHSHSLNYSDLESSDLEEELEYNEREQWEDEADLRQKRQDAMTDEQIARLFAKQSELGIEADELVIDDGLYEDNDDEMEGVGDLVAARVGLRDITNLNTPRSGKKSRRSRKGNGDFDYPDASALADTLEQYGDSGFDIMDYERPSLRPAKKGRKGKLPPELEALSDDDLRAELLVSWSADREKKAQKKAEREELRQAGLLGSAGKKGRVDLSQKYLQGMTMRQVHEELKIFLLDDGMSSRAFPPMDKRDRRALHEVADKLNLKSKSVGSGRNRFPVLYKTRFTMEYSEQHVTKLMDRQQKGFLKNNSLKGKAGRKGAGSGFENLARRSRGGFDKAAVSLRNGEVVGAGAAELGKENLGHKLMEKMGWSAGMALGREGEGRKVPVEQIMRTGRAGLG